MAKFGRAPDERNPLGENDLQQLIIKFEHKTIDDLVGSNPTSFTYKT